jgi:hypothetical protein
MIRKINGPYRHPEGCTCNLKSMHGGDIWEVIFEEPDTNSITCVYTRELLETILTPWPFPPVDRSY